MLTMRQIVFHNGKDFNKSIYLFHLITRENSFTHNSKMSYFPIKEKKIVISDDYTAGHEAENIRKRPRNKESSF